MQRNYLRRLSMMLIALACAGSAWAAQTTVKFDFSDTQMLTQYGITIPTSSAKTEFTAPITVGGVTLTPSSDPNPQVTYYKEKYNLYLFTNTAMTISVPSGSNITGITFTGRYTTLNVTPSTGSLNGLQWTGSTPNVTFGSTGSNTIYTISVTYDNNGGGDTPEPQGTTAVTGIGNLKDVKSGNKVRLYLPDENNCRVTYVSEDGSEVYLRDNTGAVCLDNVEARPNFKFNHHVAGWISGTWTLNNGMPKLVADNNTNTTQLIIAAPVTEADVAPVKIDATAIDDHAADWITASGIVVKDGNATWNGTNVTVNNLYDLDGSSLYQDPYNGAIVDITGLVVPNGETHNLVPTYENGNRPITYVVDENQDFVSPAANIANAQVRLVRQLVGGEWQTLAVPFDATGLNADIAAPQTVANGTLEFAAATAVKAGKPYVVRPASTIDELTFTGVTLSSAQPVTVMGMTGLYRPTFVNTATVIAMASVNGNPVLVRTNFNELPTTHAYFDGVGRLHIDGKYISQGADVNGDGVVDVTDVNLIINAMLSGNKTGAEDVNGDGTIDVTDVNLAINAMLTGSGSTQGGEWRVKTNNTNNK